MSKSEHRKKDGSLTVLGSKGIVGNLPAEKDKVAPTATPQAPNKGTVASEEPWALPVISDSPALIKLRKQLELVWDEQTSQGGYTSEHPSVGQCVPTSLLVQELFGGELLRVINKDISHYFNRLPDGTEVDLTRDQFPIWDPEPFVIRNREYLAKSESSMKRYNILRSRLGIGNEDTEKAIPVVASKDDEPQQESRSTLRRIAIMKGEPLPEFKKGSNEIL